MVVRSQVFVYFFRFQFCMDMMVEPLVIVQLILSSTETRPSHHSLVKILTETVTMPSNHSMVSILTETMMGDVVEEPLPVVLFVLSSTVNMPSNHSMVRILLENMKGYMVEDPLMIVLLVLSSTEIRPSHHCLVRILMDMGTTEGWVVVVSLLKPSLSVYL